MTRQDSVHRIFRYAFGSLVCLALWPVAVVSAPASLTISPGVVVNSFVPFKAFGANAAYWDGSNLSAVVPQVQASGNRFIRYPGGSSSDDFHWNGTGAFDASHHWVSDDTNYSLSWEDDELYRGTTSQSYGVAANVTDGDTGTWWLSNADTDFPNAQWVYVDLGSAKSATSMAITWGAPYATTFAVQYWSGASYPYPYAATTDQWVTTSAGVVSYAGPVQTVTFTATPAAQYYRILCLSSSAVPAQYAVAEMSVFNGATQLTVNTAASASNGDPLQSPTTASSTDPASQMSRPVSMDFVAFMAWLKNLDAGAKPLITVDFGDGTPQEAAAWVHYANVVQGYGIKDWEIGNEMDGDWETGGPLDAVDYARRYIEFYQAMKAADPTIHVYGPVPGGPYDSADNLDGNTFITDFVNRLAADPGGDKTSYADGIDFHWYPNYEDSPPILGTPALVAKFAQTDLPVMLAKLPNASTVPVLMTEYNGGINSAGTTGLVNGLWLADWLGQFLTHLGSRFASNFWDILEGDPGDNSVGPPNGYELGMLNASSDGYLYQPHAAYYAMQMLTQNWALAGDTRSHSLVQAVSSLPLTLSAYADLRPDGILSLLVVNKDPLNAYAATIGFNGFTPGATAATWTYDSTNYAWETTAAPYHATPDNPPSSGVDSAVAPGYTHSFPPYSLTVLQFTNASVPAATPTLTLTPAATPTPTPNPPNFTLVDDFDEPSRNGASPYRLNLWDGNWSASSSASTVTVSYLGSGAAGTPYSCAWTSVESSGGWSDLVTSLPGVFNAVGAGYAGTEFWAYGDGNTYWAAIQTVSVTDYNYYGIPITPPVGQWTFYQLSFTAMTRQVGWGSQSPAPPTSPAANDLTGLQFGTYGPSPRTYALKLDQIGFYRAADLGNENIPSPTSTPSPAFSPSPTPSPKAAAVSVQLLAAQAWPDPLTGKEVGVVGLNLVGLAPTLRVQVYNSVYHLVADITALGGGPGWVHVPLPPGLPKANGLYFLRVWAQSGSLSGPAKIAKLYVTR